MPEEKDLFDDIMADEDPAKDENVNIEDLKEQLSELQKERHGLLEAVKAERKGRQAQQQETASLKGRLDQVNTTVNQILEQRKTAATIADPTPATPKGIPVEFNEEGDGFITPDALRPILDPYETKIEAQAQEITNLKQQVQFASADQQAADEGDKLKASIVGEDERFNLANSKYQAARQWVEDRVLDFARTHGIQEEIKSGAALDHIFDKTLTEEYEKQFEIPLDKVVTAEDSAFHYRSMLNTAADIFNPLQDPVATPKPVTAQPDSRFQKALQKPSGLGKSTNAKGGELSMLEKLESLSNKEVENLTDAQAAAIEAALLDEEQTGGVIF